MVLVLQWVICRVLMLVVKEVRFCMSAEDVVLVFMVRG